jgi:hypothetical protein
METQSATMICGICLDDSTPVDAKSPCGFSGAGFHAKCIEKLNMFQDYEKDHFRCPHCNQPVKKRKWSEEIAALKKFHDILKDWLSLPGFWKKKKPIFLCFCRGMQRGEREKRVLRCIIARLIEQLKSTIKPLGGVRVLKNRYVNNYNTDNKDMGSELNIQLNNSNNKNNDNLNNNDQMKAENMNVNRDTSYGDFNNENSHGDLDNDDDDIDSSKSFICMPDTSSEIVIILERVAFIESMGKINRDGYCLSGWRRRIHYRKRNLKN